MTIEEAIRHAEEVAEQNEKDGDYAKRRGFNIYSDECQKCAEEHRQLAEWLKELKALREQKRHHGEWIFKNDNPLIPTGYWECSICKKGRLMVEENFCPNCGAEMGAR